MSNHAELIERLRNYRGGYDHERDCHGAANVIEQLEAENERLRDELCGLHEAMQRDEALAHEKEDSQRHYVEYCKDQRWGYVL